MEGEKSNKQNRVERVSLSDSETNDENKSMDDCSTKESKSDKIAAKKENIRYAMFTVSSSSFDSS